MILPRALGIAGAALLLATAPAVAGAGVWTKVPAPGPVGGVLTAVYSRTDADAWAVGSAGILRWNGTAWNQVSTTGLPAVQMSAVSAAAADDAWIVGSNRVSGYSRRQGTALYWDGNAWSVRAPALPVRSDLVGVAALSTGNVWAVGKIGIQSLVEHWDGTAWTQVVIPEPNPGNISSLTGLSARAADDIWAVGTYTDTDAHNQTYSLHFDGTAWSLVPMPKAPQTSTFPVYTLTSVVAVGAADVWAVGQVSEGAPTRTLIEHWNGTAWSVVASPTPGLFPVLRSVAARGANDVWAVGDIATNDSTPQYRTFTLRWDDTRWSRVASPPAGDYSELYAVAARPGTSHIWAVGNDNTGAPFVIERQ
ncbi:hypothetical protein [Actinocrispum sp. NPDC049592]|uniref:hypothetical protein n=1 Tax=Actinocrispum sp. NPDC049592 TaxID=3154835 RepID=UPI00344A706E